MLAGLAAVDRLSWLVGVLPSLTRVVSARLELTEMWAVGVVGADVALDLEMAEVPPSDSSLEGRDRLLQQIDALASAWTEPGTDAVAARSAASSFAAAWDRRVPLLTHRPQHHRAAYPPNRPTRVVLVGGADLALYLVRRHLSAADAWNLSQQLAATVSGEQYGWPVGSAAGDFRYWAEEAAAGRL